MLYFPGTSDNNEVFVYCSSWSRSPVNQRCIKANQQDQDFRIIASAWTAPPWMKTIEDWFIKPTDNEINNLCLMSLIWQCMLLKNELKFYKKCPGIFFLKPLSTKNGYKESFPVKWINHDKVIKHEGSLNVSFSLLCLYMTTRVLPSFHNIHSFITYHSEKKLMLSIITQCSCYHCFML
mgnify:CR=1 FL=1